MAKIFISYRESDAKAWAIVLRKELSERFGAEHIFLDKEGLRAGRWRAQLAAELADCRALLVPIGNSWISARDQAGALRLHLDDDVHRAELRSALQRPDITVIPVLVDRASMPVAEQLPSDLQLLVECQARQLSDQQALREVELAALVKDIASATGLNIFASEESAKPWTLVRTVVLALLGGLLSSICLGIANLVTGGSLFTFTEHAFMTIALGVCFIGAAFSWRHWRGRHRGQQQNT